MATFSDVGKDISDQFTKDLAKEQNVELSAKVNDYFSFLLKGNIGSGTVAGTFAPTIKVPDYNLEIKPELTTKDSKQKTFKLEVNANDVFTKGLKLEFATTNGTEGNLSLGFSYKNAKFGGVTGKINLPEGKDKFLTPSLYLETPDTRGFGVGATAKVILGDNASLESWEALGSYKQTGLSVFFGAKTEVDKPKKTESKPAGAENKAAEVAIEQANAKAEVKADSKAAPKAPVTTSFYAVGGFLRKCNTSNDQYGVKGAFNVTQGSLDLEFLYRKNYENGTFLKLRGNLDGNVGVSKQFKPQPGTSLILGTNVDVFTGKGNAGFQFSTDL